MGGKKSQITNTIRQARLRADLSQAALGDKVGVTRQTIIAMEGQRYSPSLELAFRLAHILGEPIEQLFQFDGEWD
jgi:putative transcriptional regulator